jgi:hypothetical protein
MNGKQILLIAIIVILAIVSIIWLVLYLINDKQNISYIGQNLIGEPDTPGGIDSNIMPASSTSFNTRLWSTVTLNNKISFPELCAKTSEEYGIKIPDVNKVSIAISGGGSRSFTCSIGYFRALNRMGYKNKAEYVSSASGGSWFYGLYSFCQTNPIFTDALLLGNSCGLINNIIEPSKITLNDLKTANKTNSLYFGHVFTSKDIIEYVAEAFILPDITIDLIWNYTVGKMILEKYGLNSEVPVAISKKHADMMQKNNIFNGKPLAMPDNMPFWICNATLFFNYITAYPYINVPMTPLYSGIPQTIKQNENIIGGYLIENFAFGNTSAPTNIQFSTPIDKCAVPYFVNLNRMQKIRTLKDMLGVSSIAFAFIITYKCTRINF